MLDAKRCAAEDKKKLMKLMKINESFDFQSLQGQWYRCQYRPEMTQQRPKIDKNNGTFIMQEVVIKPTIVIRKINERV